MSAITVAAMADVMRLGFGLASFSSRGPTRDNRVKPDISAPGVGIVAPRAGSVNQYVGYNGTSMAAPFVAGTVALMLHANPALTPDQVRSVLRNTSRDWGLPGLDVDFGWGRLDVHAAVRQAGGLGPGSPPAVPLHQTLGGTLPGTGAQAEHLIEITDPNYPLNVGLTILSWTSSSSPDFDLFVYHPDGSEVGRSDGSSRHEMVARAITATGPYRIVVRSHTGGGQYVLDVSGGMPDPSDRPPSLSVSAPAEGDTVSGSTTVQVHAVDDHGLIGVELAIDSGPFVDISDSFDGTHYSYLWNTVTAENGWHTLTAKATDSSGQGAQESRQVRVQNQSTPPGADHEVIRTGIVSAETPETFVEVEVHETGYIDLMLSWVTLSDLDLHVYSPDGSYIGTAYTLNNPERLRVDTVRWGTGVYRVKAQLYSGSDSPFSLSAKGFREVRFPGTVSPESRDSVHRRSVMYTGRGKAVLSWSGEQDLDFFVYDPAGREQSRGYTLENPERTDVDFAAGGEWMVLVNLFTGSATDYTLLLYLPEAILT